MPESKMQNCDGTVPAPLITVVLPCYNSHEHLQETLDSLRAQTFRNFEIILVDDGSNDPVTLAFLDNPGSDIKLIRQFNMGLSAARNTGIRCARGKYVLPLDCDDWLDSTYLEKVLAALLEAPDKTFVYTHMTLCGDLQGILKNDYNFFEQLFLNQLPYCLFMPREYWELIGGYDESMRRGYEDWEYNIRLGRHGFHGIAVPEPLFHYRVSETGMLKSISQKLHGELWRSIQKKSGSTYTWAKLYHIWKHWRGYRSTYPLPVYFGWLATHRLLPRSVFGILFRMLLPYRHSARIDEKASTQR